ncbi:MAG: quinohemoprotein ethanol dehydrogenase, partial [Gammaproteobacteria bacterium]
MPAADYRTFIALPTISETYMLRILIVSACLFLVALHPAAAETIVDDTSLTAVGDGENWLAYGRNYSEQRFSPLIQINDKNVGNVGIEWYLDLPNDRSLTGTPLAVDGILYFNGSYNVIRAVDAKSGKLLWEYDPKVIEHAGERLRIMWDWNRGIAFWKGKVITATIDGRLIAIDAKSGKEIWTTQTYDPSLPMVITGAPQ